MDLIYARRLNNQLCIDYLHAEITYTLGIAHCEGVHTDYLMETTCKVVRCGNGMIPCNGCYSCDIIIEEEDTLVGWEY